MIETLGGSTLADLEIRDPLAVLILTAIKDSPYDPT